MTTYQILKNILKGSTITIENSTAYVDRYKSSYCIVNLAFVKQLTYMDILEKDSGNFETGEQHYVLNDKFIKINWETKTKTILLKTIDDHVKQWIKMHYTYNIHPQYKEFEQVFNKLKQTIIRKKKLEKLKNESSIHKKY